MMESNSLPEVYLKPGELYVAFEPAVIKTLLGSCVGICLFSPAKHFGAMCHCMLPYRAQIKRDIDPFCFVDSAIEHMVKKLGERGVAIQELQIKLFGGADVTYVSEHMADLYPTVGNQNILAARTIIEKYGLKIASEKVGGKRGYKIYFYSHTGKVMLKLLNKAEIEGGRNG